MAKVGQNSKTLKLAKVGLAKVGQDHDWPKSVRPKSVWPKSAMTLVPGPVVGRRFNEELASLDFVDLKEVFESADGAVVLAGSVQRSHVLRFAKNHQTHDPAAKRG